MMKITLIEWAEKKGVHINTARNKFKQGLIYGAVKDEFNRIHVYLEKSIEDQDTELYNHFYSKTQEGPAYINHNPKPAPPLQSAMVKASEEMPPIPPKPKAPAYVKKEKKVIVPSLLTGDELEAENLRRCRELGINYDYVTKALQRNFFGLPENFSQYMDEFERSKMNVHAFISISNAEMEALFPDTSNKEPEPVRSPIKKERSEFDIAYDLCEENEKDYDLVKQFFEKDGNQCLMGDAVIIEFMEQYKKGKGKDMNEWAIERVIANRNK